jgi:hypothetical protein
MVFLLGLAPSFYLLGDHLEPFLLPKSFLSPPDILVQLRFEIDVHLEGHHLCLSDPLLFQVGINGRVRRSFSQVGRLCQIQIPGIIAAIDRSFLGEPGLLTKYFNA